MKYRLLAYMAASGLMFILPGCVNPISKLGKTTKEAVEAYAVDPISLYLIAGAALMGIGFIVIAFGGKATGGTLAACGAAMALFGRALSHAWIPFVCMGVLMAIVCCLAYDRWRKWKATKEVVAAGEKLPVIKDYICDGNSERQNAIRSVIQKAKSELRAVGRIQ